jgi:hypothetical protein
MVGPIKLVSGWSNPGGSTEHHIKLTNLLNANGYECTFYGPHPWHMNKCKGALLNDCKITVHDTVISHFLMVNTRNLKKHILSCHESNLFPLKDLPLEGYDVIQFVSQRQKEYHSINHPNVIIPPIVDRITWKAPETKTAGVIGSIDSHKQTHLSVQKALDDGYKRVRLYGIISDLQYFNQFIEPLLKYNVTLENHCNDKTIMYNTLDAVYHNSKYETYGLVEAECKLAGIPYIGAEYNPEVIETEEILGRWKTILQ